MGGMKLIANENCSASVQVLERFRGVFSSGLLALDTCVMLCNRLPPFTRKMGRKCCF